MIGPVLVAGYSKVYIMIHSRISIFLPLSLVIALSGCSGCGDEHEGPVGTDRMEQGAIDPNADDDAATIKNAQRDGDQDMNLNNTTDTDGSSVSTDGTNSTGSNATTGDTNMSDNDPARAEAMQKARVEREAASQDLRGLRAKLMSELDQVRDKLRDGTRTKDQGDKDQARAASLAQGLARLDNALEAIDASTDATWAQIKQHSEKEVKDMRAWMDENEVDGVVEG